jgi:hypothetical protein
VLVSKPFGVYKSYGNEISLEIDVEGMEGWSEKVNKLNSSQVLSSKIPILEDEVTSPDMGDLLMKRKTGVTLLQEQSWVT